MVGYWNAMMNVGFKVVGEDSDGGPMGGPAPDDCTISPSLGPKASEGEEAVLGPIHEVKELLRNDGGLGGWGGSANVLEVLGGAVFVVPVKFEEGGTGRVLHQALAQGVPGSPSQACVGSPCLGQVGAPPASGMVPHPPLRSTEPM